VRLTRACAPPGLAAAAAVSVAPAALAWLRSGRRGHVLHVFDRAAYLIDERGEILLLAAPPVGMGPFTLLANFQDFRLAEGLSIDAPAWVRHDHLCVGEFSIRLDTAAPWRAAPDWAAKIHLSAAPVYYHNYLLGEMLASQLHATCTRECGGLVGVAAAGQLLIDRIFKQGALMRWDALIEEATGRPLSARDFADYLSES